MFVQSQGIAFDEQVVEEVPTNETDYTLDMVVTPSTVYKKDSAIEGR